MKRPGKGAHVRKPKHVSRAELAQSYAELLERDGIAAVAILLEYGLERVAAERDGAPARQEGPRHRRA